MYQFVIPLSTFILIATACDGNCGGGSGAQYSGMATFFSNSNIGACGQSINGQTQIACGISGEWFSNTASSTNDPKCYQQSGNCVQVTYGVKTIVVPVMDKCNCANKTDVNLSQAAFEQLAPIQIGVIPIQWSFVNVPIEPQLMMVVQAPPQPQLQVQVQPQQQYQPQTQTQPQPQPQPQTQPQYLPQTQTQPQPQYLPQPQPQPQTQPQPQYQLQTQTQPPSYYTPAKCCACN